MKHLGTVLRYALWPTIVAVPWLLVLSWEHPAATGRWPLGNPLFTYFLTFVLVVTVSLSLVLRHLIQRSNRPSVNPAKLYTFMDEVLSKDPTAQRFHEAGVFCCEAGEWDRAVQYLAQVGPQDGPLYRSARYHLLIAYLEGARFEEAARLQAELPADALTTDERYNVALAYKKHHLPGRAKELFLKLFLMDIGFRDVGRQLEELGDLERDDLAPDHQFLRGAIPERYARLRVNGDSGSSLTCSAVDRDLGRPVVLRVLKPANASGEAIDTFLSEARSLAAYEHAAILKVYDIRKDRLPYFCLEPFEGRAASEAMAGRPLLQRVDCLDRMLELAELLGGFEPEHLLVGEKSEIRLVAIPPVPRTLPRAFLAGLLEPDGLPPAPVARALADVRALLEGPSEVGELRRALAVLEQALNQEQEERERAAFGQTLGWLDRAHRYWIHGLKSKFAVVRRFPGEPARALAVFGRQENLAEVDRMLAGLQEHFGELDGLTAGESSSLATLLEGLRSLDLGRLRSDVAAIRQISAERAGALLDSLSELFVSLSTGLARLLETFEVDLSRLVSGVVSGCVYAQSIELPEPGSGDWGLRVSRPDEFRKDLHTALENLLNNAFEAGARSVSVQLAHGKDRPTVSLLLRDDGPGLAPEVVERVARERFSGKAGGTGTGVLSSMRLLSKHGGTLELANRTDGPGALVTITLPTMME